MLDQRRLQFIFALLALGPLSSAQKVDARPYSNLPATTALSLASAYVADEAKAARMYRGKTIKVTGRIKDIGYTDGRLSIAMKGSGRVDVVITFPDTFLRSVSKLKKGQSATVVVKVIGPDRFRIVATGLQLT